MLKSPRSVVLTLVPISHKVRGGKSEGLRQVNIVSLVIPGVTTILFFGSSFLLG